MEENFILVINFCVEAYHSKAFFVLKFVLGIYLAVVIVDIILLSIARGIGANARYLMYGDHYPTELASRKKKTRKKWDELCANLESGNENDWKIMIIKADDVLFKLFKKLGYKGGNMGEVLEKVEPGHFEEVKGIEEAHEIRNKIIHDDDFTLSKDVAKEVMSKYETLLKSFDV